MSVCRFCKQWAPDGDLLHYSVRSYAHHACYLQAGKDITRLGDSQIAAFPYKLVIKHGLQAIAEAACDRQTARARALEERRKDRIWRTS